MSADVEELVTHVERVVAQAAALDHRDLSVELLDHVGLVFADTIGVLTAGARASEVVALAADPMLALGAAGPARALTPGLPTGDPLTIAWLNGSAGTFLELDEGFRPTGHPAVQVIPAALAVAEAMNAPGRDLALAIIAGYEVAARLFEAFRLPHDMHPHGHFGALGAATAVAILQGEDPVDTVGLAATQLLLTGWEACYEGATARNTWSGHANRVGVLAPVLKRAGFTGSLASHLSVVAPYLVRTEALAEPVEPNALRISRNYLKFHSACVLTHTALDAVLKARSLLKNQESYVVREVDVVTVSNNLRVDRQPRPNALSTRFSLPYAIAAALVTGASGPASFDWRPDVAELAKKVRVSASLEFDAQWPAAAPASVRLTTSEETVEALVLNHHGHHRNPATRERIRGKFMALGGTAGVFDALAAFSNAADCAALPLDITRRSGSDS